MKLSIFGRHPIPQGGFNGVMSLFEAIEFSRLGYETSLLIPFSDQESYQKLIANHKLQTLDDLPRFGGKFDIIPVFPDGENFQNCDVLIYQSYEYNDWIAFEDICRSKSRLFTKNFPKFVPSPNVDDNVSDHLRAFDLVACSLQEDFNYLTSNAEYCDRHPAGFAYVPRGACPEWLHPGYKTSLPLTLGFDVPNNPDIRALEHYIEPVKKLQTIYPELQTLSIGREVSELNTIAIPFGRFDKIYEQFFNRIHAYCTINYQYSPQHLQAPIQQSVPEWRYKAIYELQNIEAQMSGSVIVGHRSNLIPELYRPGVTGITFPDFSKEDEIYRCLNFALQHWHVFSTNARRFAERRFSWSHCIDLWSKAIQQRMKHLPAARRRSYFPSQLRKLVDLQWGVRRLNGGTHATGH